MKNECRDSLKYGKRGLLFGVGINDADYVIQKNLKQNGKSKRVWYCPFYSTWTSMMRRCYSELYQNKRPSYIGCIVAVDWYKFSNFKGWMEGQAWEGKHLDKDFLVEGNKIYSPETCVFISAIVNTFVTDSRNARGELPLGVYKLHDKYGARCNDPFKVRSRHISVYKTPEEAHKAWKERKHQYAVELANSEYVTDERVIQVLLTKYKTI